MTEKTAAPPQTKALAPIDELCRNLEKMSTDFKTLLPQNVSPEKFVRTLKTAIRTNAKLVACNRQSLYAEAMKCAQDGLLPDGREAALVPFKEDAKYLPMVAGICKRARNSGEVAMVDAQTVFEKDTYEAWTDEKGPHFKHIRFRGGDRGKALLTYAYATTKDGSLYFEEMDASVILEIKKMALAKAGGKATPWTGPFEDEQWRKSALHRLLKYRVPSSSDMDALIDRDNDLIDLPGKTGDEPKAEAPNTPKRTGAFIDAEMAATAEEVNPQGEFEKPSEAAEVPL